MKIEYHPFVVDDLSDAETHYGQLQPGLSQAFRAEVIQTIKQIKDRPFLYAEINGVRRALLRHFPFSIVYRILSKDKIRILLIRHHKRQPAFGSGRR